MGQAVAIFAFIEFLIIGAFLEFYLSRYFIYTAKDEQLSAPHCKCTALHSDIFKAKSSYRVVNGAEVTDPEDFSYAMSMIYRGRTVIHSFCSGSIITPLFALTAARCTQDMYENSSRIQETYIAAGLDHDLNKIIKSKNNFKRVKGFIRHPDYDDDNNDIALIELETPFEFNEETKIFPACLFGLDTFDASYLLQASYEFSLSYSDYINQKLSVIDKSKNFFSLPKLRMTYFVEFTGYSSFLSFNNPNSSLCNGDSGSGIGHFSSNRFFLVGVRSYSLFEKILKNEFVCNSPFTSRATSIPHYMDFITDKVKDAQNICHSQVKVFDYKKLIGYLIAIGSINLIFFIGLIFIAKKISSK